MSELKVHRIIGLDERCARVDNDYYLKSEADKVIARHKYKRCLAMAMWCDMGLTCYNEKLDSFSCKRAEFFYRWYNRWWKIAEKFKDSEH